MRGPTGIDMFVPDFEFTSQCKQHDCCYEDCKETQQCCDDEFYELMLSCCHEVYGDDVIIDQCYLCAYLNYQIVVELGTLQVGECPTRALQNQEQEQNCTKTMLPQQFPANDGFVKLVDKRHKAQMIGASYGIAILILAIMAIWFGIFIPYYSSSNNSKVFRITGRAACNERMRWEWLLLMKRK